MLKACVKQKEKQLEEKMPESKVQPMYPEESRPPSGFGHEMIEEAEPGSEESIATASEDRIETEELNS